MATSYELNENYNTNIMSSFNQYDHTLAANQIGDSIESEAMYEYDLQNAISEVLASCKYQLPKNV